MTKLLSAIAVFGLSVVLVGCGGDAKKDTKAPASKDAKDAKDKKPAEGAKDDKKAAEGAKDDKKAPEGAKDEKKTEGDKK